MQRQWLSGAFAASGALAIAGALLPWLTLYAGLYQYNGMAGLYGRLVVAAGAAAAVGGALSARVRWRWMRWTGVALGLALLGFAIWLYAGLQEVVHRPESIMIVARPGPGLFVVFAASALMVISSAALPAWSARKESRPKGPARRFAP